MRFDPNFHSLGLMMVKPSYDLITKQVQTSSRIKCLTNVCDSFIESIMKLATSKCISAEPLQLIVKEEAILWLPLSIVDPLLTSIAR